MMMFKNKQNSLKINIIPLGTLIQKKKKTITNLSMKIFKMIKMKSLLIWI
jgi:hypothetical protein